MNFWNLLWLWLRLLERLPVQVGVDPEERDLLRLYPQPRGREAAVEYVPGPPTLPRRQPAGWRGRGDS